MDQFENTRHVFANLCENMAKIVNSIFFWEIWKFWRWFAYFCIFEQKCAKPVNLKIWKICVGLEIPGIFLRFCAKYAIFPEAIYPESICARNSSKLRSKLIEICAQTCRNLSKDAESVNLKDFEIWVNLKIHNLNTLQTSDTPFKLNPISNYDKSEKRKIWKYEIWNSFISFISIWNKTVKNMKNMRWHLVLRTWTKSPHPLNKLNIIPCTFTVRNMIIPSIKASTCP